MPNTVLVGFKPVLLTQENAYSPVWGWVGDEPGDLKS